MTGRSDKQFQELEAQEVEFHRRLVELLRACAAGRCTNLLLTSSLRPEIWPPRIHSPVADELHEAASEILALREQLRLDDHCLAAMYRDACRRHVQLDDHHRPGPRRQALEILQRMGEDV